jgi:DNA repair exonuclease SbcCD nuclease subunit
MLAHALHHYDREDISPEEAAKSGHPMGKKKLRAHGFRGFLDRVSQRFPHVVYISGNHEFYNGKWVGSLGDLRKECSYYPNIHFLECDAWTHNDITFVGGTLWTDMNKGDPMTLHAIQDMMNDFHIIRNDDRGYTKLRPMHTVERHLKTVAYIRSVIENNPTSRYVVVGHHAPSNLSIHPRYASATLMNGGYVSDLSNFILDHPQIKLWTHGHVHSPFDYMIGSTRIVCNPRGYIGYEPQAADFKLKYVEV